jgi:transposase
MARYKDYSYDQGKFIPISFDKQIIPGTFEYTLSYLIDNELDLSVFEGRYRNDELGAPAYDPAILLKIILYAYSRGIVTSRQIARCCEENVIFMALSADTRPHYTTIADFVSSLEEEITSLFREILLVSDELGLIGKEMFAIDGCKLPSNASKEWSGTRADFKRKSKKLKETIRKIVRRHRELDQAEREDEVISREKRYVQRLQHQVKKIRDWLKENEDKPGSRGGVRKSNLTDNESAKMKSSHGVIQGYDGVAVVDEKHQVIVHAEAFGEAQEHGLLEPVVEGTRENFQAIGKEEEIFDKAKVTADSGFHTEANMEMLEEEGIDGYVADKLYRKRDPFTARGSG